MFGNSLEHDCSPLTETHAPNLVTKVVPGPVSRGIHCCPNFFLSFGPTSFSTFCDCVATVYELPLLSNNTARETFLHISGAVRIADWIFITGEPARW